MASNPAQIDNYGWGVPNISTPESIHGNYGCYVLIHSPPPLFNFSVCGEQVGRRRRHRCCASRAAMAPRQAKKLVVLLGCAGIWRFQNRQLFSPTYRSSGLNGENFESLISDAVMDTARSGSRSPDCFLEDIEPSLEFPRVPYSCPLPIIDSAAKEIGTTSTEAGDNFVGTAAKVNKNSNRNQPAMNVTENPLRYSAKFSDRMPDRHIGSGMNRVSRSSSLKESPHARQPNVVPPVDKTGDRSSPNAKFCVCRDARAAIFKFQFCYL